MLVSLCGAGITDAGLSEGVLGGSCPCRGLLCLVHFSSDRVVETLTLIPHFVLLSLSATLQCVCGGVWSTRGSLGVRGQGSDQPVNLYSLCFTI